MRKKELAIIISIFCTIVLLLGFIFFISRQSPMETKPENRNEINPPVAIQRNNNIIIDEEVKFKLTDGETGEVISNKNISICDDREELKSNRGDNEKFCGGKNSNILKIFRTNSAGIFLLDINEFDVKPPSSIVLGIEGYKIIKIERSNTITHHFDSSHIRVVNGNEKGHIISNKLYNLETKEMREIFTNGDPEVRYNFVMVELKAFKKDRKDVYK